LLSGKGLEYIIYLLPVDRCRDLFEVAEARETEDDGDEGEMEEQYEDYRT
jgi:hypothetical protein